MRNFILILWTGICAAGFFAAKAQDGDTLMTRSMARVGNDSLNNNISNKLDTTKAKIIYQRRTHFRGTGGVTMSANGDTISYYSDSARVLNWVRLLGDTTYMHSMSGSVSGSTFTLTPNIGAPVIVQMPTGPTGPAGPQGSQGIQGTSGSTGPAGSNGTNGTNGINGATWYSGTTVPASGTGVNGDYYLRSITGDVYNKVAGAWGSPIANLTGPTGLTGATGPAGTYTAGTNITIASNVISSLQTTTLTGDVTGTGTTSIATTIGAITGTTAGGNAAAGKVGEYIFSAVATGSAVSLANGTPSNVTSIILTAGDWDVEANVNYAATLATVTGKTSGISTTSATLPTDGSEVNSGLLTTLITGIDGATLPRKRINITSTTTVYLVASSAFSVGALKVYGVITARRVR